MEHYKHVFIATGAITFLYVMMKIFTNLSEKTLEDTQNSEESDKPVEQASDLPVRKHKITELHTINNNVKSAETQFEAVKWKLDDSAIAMKLPRPRPNFFVAFQVNDIEIHKKVKKLQEKLIEKHPSLFPAIVNVSTLHITLAVTHLPNDEDKEIVKRKLDEWAEKNLKTYFKEPCILKFTGIKTFNNVVAYVDIEQCENYKKISDFSIIVHNILSSAGYTTGKKKITPHLTFLKLSKDYKLLKSKRNFKDVFESLKECTEHFGKQEVHNIQLLSMNEPKNKFGYYKCFYEIKISDTDANMDHSECCSSIAKPKKFTK